MIVNKLSEILGRKRLKPGEVARISGLSKTAIHKIYYDKTKGIDFETMNKLCFALDVTVGELFEYVPD